ncbi:hypothetical protein THAOC_07807 [Thalassiosira oceanica]|uniref:Uncharacterized protein n=1 Tax=Thalassiosira oceanica TaxID=159749 RepID=K0TJM5_THAOC|nr:hypothetical protein THAOC_07807 [Thalassiosira oceanica]|eukprot:EJK70802.1 hypothetical protein THAOC_07807 [Thalassiosira oceanica]
MIASSAKSRPSKAEPPPAVGKSSFACFSVDYLPAFLPTIYLMMCGGLTSQPTCENEISPCKAAKSCKISEASAPTAGIRGLGPSVRIESAKTDSFDIILLSQQFWPLEWELCSSPARKKPSLTYLLPGFIEQKGVTNPMGMGFAGQ